jgi:stress response protein YsnF
VSGEPEVVLHEERLDVDVRREATRAVVRRRIVTQMRTIEVPVRREVLEVEHLPTDDVALPVRHEPRREVVMVLSEEVPVVELHVQPYERVTVVVETVQEQLRLATPVSAERAEITTSGDAAG